MNNPHHTAPPRASSTYIERIDPLVLISRLSASARAYALEIVACTGSTNTDLLDRWRTHPHSDHKIVRLAYEQTAGRGRQGRRWETAPGDALLFSVAHRFTRPIAQLGGLSLAIGSAILAGLRAFAPSYSRHFALKWPNDVLLNGKKLAGILVETAQHTASTTDTIIGIGLNLQLPPAMRQSSAQADTLANTSLPYAALNQLFPVTEMTEAFAALLNALIPTLAHFGEKGFAPFLTAWNQDHAYTGHDVCLSEQGQEKYQGRVLGADAQGRLLLETPVGIQTVMSGDLSVRVKPSN